MTVFAFHNIVNSPADANSTGTRITCSQFETAVDRIASSYRLVPLSDYVHHLCEARQTKGIATVTFDDGYWGTFAHGLPILKRRGVPAAAFVVTGGLDCQDVRPFSFDVPEIILEIAVRAGRLDRTIATERLRVWKRRHKRLPSERRKHELAQLARTCGVPLEGVASCPPEWTRFRRANISVLRAAVSAGWEVHSHTVTHPSLAGLPTGEIMVELGESRAFLRERLGVESQFLAYPFGSPRDVNRSVVAQAKEAGYLAAFSTTCELESGGLFCVARSEVEGPELVPAALMGLSHSPKDDLAPEFSREHLQGIQPDHPG